MTAASAGSAVKLACAALRRKLAALAVADAASPLFGAPVDDYPAVRECFEKLAGLELPERAQAVLHDRAALQGARRARAPRAARLRERERLCTKAWASQSGAVSPLVGPRSALIPDWALAAPYLLMRAQRVGRSASNRLFRRRCSLLASPPPFTRAPSRPPRSETAPRGRDPDNDPAVPVVRSPCGSRAGSAAHK